MRSQSVPSGPVARSFLQQCSWRWSSDLSLDCGLLTPAGQSGVKIHKL
jgi:hypothetical protein